VNQHAKYVDQWSLSSKVVFVGTCRYTQTNTAYCCNWRVGNKKSACDITHRQLVWQNPSHQPVCLAHAPVTQQYILHHAPGLVCMYPSGKGPAYSGPIRWGLFL